MLKSFSLLVVLAIVSGSFQYPTQSESGSKYVIPHFMANWHAAVEHCNFLGRRLVVVEDQTKGSELYEAIEASNVYVKGRTPIWVGASDLANEGYFHWQATGRRVVYSNWADSQPDNGGPGGEHCMEVSLFGNPRLSLRWEWNDRDCGVAHYFVCEEKPSDENLN